MTLTLTFNLPFFLSDATSPSLHPKFTNFPLIKLQCCSIPFSLSLLSQRSLFLNQTQMKISPICAKNNKRRSGYGVINKFVIESAYFFATKLDILPEPFVMMIKEFGGGKGGGVRFFKGFGGGGFFKNNKNLLFLAFVVVFGLVMWLGLGKRLQICDFFLVILVLISFGGLICTSGKSGFKDWVQSVCVIASVGFLGLRRENLQKAMKEFGVRKNSKLRKKRAL